MSYNKIVCVCLCLLLAASTLLRGEESPAERTGRIRFRLYRNHLVVVQGSLGKLKKKNLLIDTGANPTVLDREIAQQLDVKPTDSVKALSVVTGSVTGHFAILPSLQLGPLRSKDLRVAVADLSLLSSKVGIRIDAVVGLDILGQSSFRIDYGQREIVFGPVDFDSAAVPFGGDAHFVAVPAAIDDRPLRLMIDTGTASLVLFANRIGGWSQDLPLAGLAVTATLGGKAPLPAVLLNRIRIGKDELGPRNAYLASRLDCCEFDGVLGISAVRVKQISFDFEHHLFSWQLQDRAIPSMSESGPANCIPAGALGLTTPGLAGIASTTEKTASCGSSAALDQGAARTRGSVSSRAWK